MQRRRFPGRDFERERGRCCNPSRDRKAFKTLLLVRVSFQHPEKLQYVGFLQFKQGHPWTSRSVGRCKFYLKIPKKTIFGRNDQLIGVKTIGIKEFDKVAKELIMVAQEKKILTRCI